MPNKIILQYDLIGAHTQRPELTKKLARPVDLGKPMARATWRATETKLMAKTT
jgi:hypothetical protein